MPTSGARHQGISHHTRTALEHTLVPVVVPLPPTVDPAELGATQHKVRTVEVPDVGALLEAAGLQVTTMGRGPDQEPRFFAACAAAGVVAADLLRSDTDRTLGRNPVSQRPSETFRRRRPRSGAVVHVAGSSGCSA